MAVFLCLNTFVIDYANQVLDIISAVQQKRHWTLDALVIYEFMIWIMWDIHHKINSFVGITDSPYTDN